MGVTHLRPRRLHGSLVTGAVLLAALGVDPPSAHAASYSLTSRTVYQDSQIRLFDDRSVAQFRALRRFYQWLDGRVYGVGPGEDISAVVSIRYHTDFGQGFHRDTPAGAPLPVTDENNDVQMSYLYVDWRNVVDGLLDLRIGRQLIIDELDWFSLDGLKVTLRPLRGSSIDLYAGRTPRYGALLSQNVFLNDGLEVNDGEGLAFGGSLSAQIGQDLSFSLAYRQEIVLRRDDIMVFNRAGDDATTLLIRDGSGGKIGQRGWLLGAGVGYTFRPLKASLYARGTWNFLVGELDQARVGLAWDPRPGIHFGAEYLRVYPRLDGDSIFIVFNLFAYDRGRVELTYELIDGLTIEGGYFVQQNNGGPHETLADPTQSRSFTSSSRNHGINAGIRYNAGWWSTGLTSELATNIAGRLAFGGSYRRFEAFGNARFLEGRVQADLRAGYDGIQNDWFEGADLGEVDDEVQSYFVSVGARGRVIDGLDARVDFVKNFSSLLQGSYRLFALLEYRY